MDVTRTDHQSRHSVNSGRGGKHFSHSADHTHRMNVSDRPKRGGIRL